MSGLTARNQAGQSGLVAPKVDFQRFTTTSATWTKPADVSIVWIEAIGGGAGGGGGAGSGSARGSGGGGGGGGGGAGALPPIHINTLNKSSTAVISLFNNYLVFHF